MVTAIDIIAILGISGIAIAVPIAVTAINKYNALKSAIIEHKKNRQNAIAVTDIVLYQAAGLWK